mgnify:CR=1 FL=1
MAYTTIDDPSVYFQTTLYTGNGSADHAITNGGNSDLQPDWVWIKNRDAADSHCLFDSTRGATEVLHSDTTAAEATDADTLDSFASDGFQVDADVKVNTNAETYVAWQWKANGGTTTSNAAGANGADHASVFQADNTAGFSIVTYTSDSASGDTTIKHGLSTAPTFMIHKSRSATGPWWVYHKDLGNDGYLVLDTTGTNQSGSTNVWRNTAPTSSVFKLGLDSIAASDETMVAYVFAPKQGYSKFGGYRGNNNADGPFVYLGFKPAYVIVKRTDSAASWIIFDSKRPGYNGTGHRVYANGVDPEDTDSGDSMDLLSNGFKMRGGSGSTNAIAPYVYMAFAENPFVSSTGVPATAR